MQLFESWMNRVAPGWTHHDIFAEFAWSAWLAFLRRPSGGPAPDAAGLIAQLHRSTSWTGDGISRRRTSAQKMPSKCFAYFKI